MGAKSNLNRAETALQKTIRNIYQKFEQSKMPSYLMHFNVFVNYIAVYLLVKFKAEMTLMIICTRLLEIVSYCLQSQFEEVLKGS